MSPLRMSHINRTRPRQGLQLVIRRVAGSQISHIFRRVSAGSEVLPSLARRVSMQQHAELPCRGNTRGQRYYGPLRHPEGNPACGVGPGLSLAGRPHEWSYPRVEGHAPSPLGVSRVALDLHVPTCRRHYPGGPLGSDRSWDGLFPPVSPSSPATAAFPMLVRGRRPHWTFRGLLDVHSHYGLSARCIASATHLSRRLQRFRYLHRRPDSYRLERPSCRVGIAPTEEPTPFHCAH